MLGCPSSASSLCFSTSWSSSPSPTSGTFSFSRLAVPFHTTFLWVSAIWASDIDCYRLQLRTPTNILLLSLAVSDFLVGLLLWPGEIYMSTSCWAFGDVSCFLHHFVSFAITSASVGNMVLISADRYVAICDPLHYNLKVTVKRTQICVCLCWFLCFVYSSVILRDQLAHPEKCSSCYGECVINIDIDGGILDLVVIFILPLCIIVTLYLRVFVVAVSQARAMRSHVTCGKLQHSAPFRAKKSELKAARTLGVLVLCFLICFCPFYIASLAGGSTFSSSSQYVLYLFDFNSCVNPLIYALFYPWFRRAVTHIVTLRILQPGSREAHVL
ncbi:trace amine-associated receptor 13c-like isoform X1 [Syngnathoides biaculeatus]|uniref:trace amine-associated receptor 13c-like isoform X1 n=1 Tax=Syngnathoides biaculeatus TaxID=300417 RepID=UPI002ADE896A|nr:trace amine-associated receptor 13c-like isoform X1 [Syngnathoides biaculeatus]